MSYTDLARLGLTCRPLEAWPGVPTPAADRVTSPFKATFGSTVAALRIELEQLDAKQVVLMLDVLPSRIRNDGLPYADAKAASPGVVLAFDSRHGPLRYACDRFLASWTGPSGLDWQHNLRAVTLGLEALRKVQRYGIADDAQQYRGYAQLPSGIAAPATHMTTDEAREFIATAAGRDGQDALVADDLIDPAMRRIAYRAAARRLHPDAGGSAEAFARLQAAHALLERSSS